MRPERKKFTQTLKNIIMTTFLLTMIAFLAIMFGITATIAILIDLILRIKNYCDGGQKNSL